jgi:hypothetical protein
MTAVPTQAWRLRIKSTPLATNVEARPRLGIAAARFAHLATTNRFATTP